MSSFFIISTIIVLVLCVSVFFNIVMIKQNKQMKEDKEEAEKELESYEKVIDALRVKIKKQDKRNRIRMNSLADEVAKLKNVSIAEVWRMF